MPQRARGADHRWSSSAAAWRSMVGLLDALGRAGAGRLHAARGVLFHNFWAVPAGRSRWCQQLMFMKNLSIAGGLLVLAALRCRRGQRRRAAPRAPQPDAAAPMTQRALGAAGLLQSRRWTRCCASPAPAWPDWVAFALFFPAWVGYAMFAKPPRRHTSRRSWRSTNRVRRQWMLQTTYREVRVVDGVVIQNLSTQPLVLRLDDDPHHRRPARGARHGRQGERAGARDAVRGAHHAPGLRPQGAAAARRSSSTRSSASPGRCASTPSARCWSPPRRRRRDSASESLSREAFADKAGRDRRHGRRDLQRRPARATTSRSPRWAGSSRPGSSWRRRRRRLRALPARVPVRGAGRAQRPEPTPCRRPQAQRSRARRNAAELPVRVGREEVAVARADVAGRRGARAAAQHVLVAHELAVVLAERAGAAARKPGYGR